MTRPRLKIRFRKDRDLWEVDYRDADGQRRRPLFSTEEAAHEHATGVLRSQGLLLAPVEDREISVRAYAARWLTLIQHEKDENTVRNCQERLDGHVLPALGHFKVRELHRGHIKAFLAQKRGRGYAKNTVRLMRAAVSAMLSDAVGDIDWGERTLRVERAWNLGRVKATKTYEERTVDLTPELVRALAQHMTWLKAEALRRGWGEPEWLFPNEEGKPHDEARVRKVFKRALGKAKLPAFRLL